MRRFIMMSAVIVFAAFAISEAATEVKGKLLIGGYAGYGLGLGDDFKEHESVLPFATFIRQLEPGVAFGGRIGYGLSNKLLIAGTVGFQRMKSKEIVETYDPPIATDNSTTDTWIAVNANVVYLTAPSSKLCPYLEVGPGLYFDPDDLGGGVDGGIGGMYTINPSLSLDVGARLHLVLGMDVLTYVELHGGINFFIGGAK